MNAKISITNSTVTIHECDNQADGARDELLRRLFYARHKATIMPDTKRQWVVSPIGRNCSTTITAANMKR